MRPAASTKDTSGGLYSVWHAWVWQQWLCMKFIKGWREHKYNTWKNIEIENPAALTSHRSHICHACNFLPPQSNHETLPTAVWLSNPLMKENLTSKTRKLVDWLLLFWFANVWLHKEISPDGTYFSEVDLMFKKKNRCQTRWWERQRGNICFKKVTEGDHEEKKRT